MWSEYEGPYQLCRMFKGESDYFTLFVDISDKMFGDVSGLAGRAFIPEGQDIRLAIVINVQFVGFPLLLSFSPSKNRLSSFPSSTITRSHFPASAI